MMPIELFSTSVFFGVAAVTKKFALVEFDFERLSLIK